MGSSTTTRNFGIRRFTNLVREGRFRAPAAADLMLGTGVEIDPASTDDPQEVRQIDGAGPNDLGGLGILGLVGLLWYEHDSQTYVGAPAGALVQDFNTAPRGRMVQVLRGPGAKVWFRNTEAATTEAGLNFPNTRVEVVMVEDLGFHGTSDLAVNDLLAWDAVNGFWGRTAVLAEALMRVTYVDHSINTCDAELLL
jgi:hypothetical protein